MHSQHLPCLQGYAVSDHDHLVPYPQLKLLQPQPNLTWSLLCDPVIIQWCSIAWLAVLDVSYMYVVCIVSHCGSILSSLPPPSPLPHSLCYVNRCCTLCLSSDTPFRAAADHGGRVAGPVWWAIWRYQDIPLQQRPSHADSYQAHRCVHIHTGIVCGDIQSGTNHTSHPLTMQFSVLYCTTTV